MTRTEDRIRSRTHIAAAAVIILAAVVFLLANPLKAEADSKSGEVILCDYVITYYNDDQWYSTSDFPMDGWTAGRFKLSKDRTTLYLDGFTFSGSCAAIIQAATDMTVHVSGTNNVGINDFIDLKYAAPNGPCDLTIEGESGSTIRIGNATSNNKLMDVKNYTNSNCTFYSSKAIDIAGTMTLESGIIVAPQLYADKVHMKKGQCIIQQAGSTGVQLSGELNVEGGSLYCTSNSTTGENFPGIEAGSAKVSGGVINAQGSFNLSGDLTQTAGKIMIGEYLDVNSDDAVLSCSGGSMEGYCVFCDGQIKLSGDGQITADAISAQGQFTGTGGKATAAYYILTGGMTISGASVSAQTGGVQVNGDLSVTSGELISTCSDTEDGFRSGLSVSGALTLSGGTINATSKISDNSPVGVSVSKAVNISGGTFSAVSEHGPGLRCWKEFTMSGGTFYGKSGSASRSGLESYLEEPKLTNGIWMSDPDDGYIGYSSNYGEIVYNSGNQPAQIVKLEKATSISIRQNPTGEFYSGDVFDPAGLVLDVTFAGGQTVSLTYNDRHKKMFSFTPADKVLDAGTNQVGVGCLDKSLSVQVTAKAFASPVLTGSVAAGSAELTWEAVDGAQSYEVYACKPGGQMSCIGTTAEPGYTDTSLSPGDKRNYQVHAVRTNNKGQRVETLSNTLTLSIPLAEPQLMIKSATYDSLTLAWNEVEGADCYELYRSTDGDTNFSKVMTTSDCGTVDKNLVTGVEYTYYVVAVKSTTGVRSRESNNVTGKVKPRPVITPPKTDDPSGTKFVLLQARAGKITKSSVQLLWRKVPGAKKYVIYGNKCGIKNKYKKLTTTTKLKLTYKKVAGKKVKKGTYYKFIVYALNSKGKIISTSKTVHVATTGGKVGNDKKVTTAAKKNKVTLKKGKTFKLKAKAIPASKKLKVKRHRKMAYETSNKKIATVSSKGVIKGKSKGTCYVYAYTQNGKFAKVKVTVK